MIAATTEENGLMHAVAELHQRLKALEAEMDSKGLSFLHQVDSPESYERAMEVIEQLTDGRELTDAEQALLADLSAQVSHYEESAEEFAAFNARMAIAVSPIDMIRHLMEQHGLTGSDLPEIGDRTVVSRVLRGERKLNVEQIARLAERFRMDAHVFIPKYETQRQAVSMC